MVLVDKIMDSLDNGDIVLGVFLDFSKAFDTVNHSILLQKLSCYGITGICNQWFVSYLNSRKQYVVYNNQSSQFKYITCGVPQGSILGPVLFLLYVNDIINASNILFPILFADDTNVFLKGKNADILIDTMNSELQELVNWLCSNKLSLNVAKTHYMFFKLSKKCILSNTRLLINNAIVSEVQSTKFLGIIIDSNLKWTENINLIKTKISKGIGIIAKARKYLKQSTLLTMYYAFIYPHLTYCIEVWGSASKSLMEPLFKVQKRIGRIIAGVPYKAHTDPIFTSLKILDLAKIYR